MFGRLSELLDQRVSTGGCAFLQVSKGRYVYYLVTKKRYYEKPTYESLEESLLKARNHCLVNNISRISMPLIGCGLDGLQWNRVKRIIDYVFGVTEIEINVYIYKH